MKIEWHYLQANHGNGPVDGIGDSIKHPGYRVRR